MYIKFNSLIFIIVMKNTNFRKLISGEIRKALRKKNLNEGYAWERQPGQPLPTMEDVQTAHNEAKQTNAGAVKHILADILNLYANKTLSKDEAIKEIFEAFGHTKVW